MAKESLKSALVQIAVAAALLALGVYVVYRRGADRQASSECIDRARVTMHLDNPADLRRAVDELVPAFASSTRRPDAHAVAARALAELAVGYGVSEAERPAREHLAEALQGASDTEERYAAEALVRILDDRPDEALAVLDRAAERGSRRADLEYVRARVLLAQGDLPGARRLLADAAAFSSTNSRIQAAYGDVLMDLGELDAASRAYEQALAANPAHLRAKLGALAVELRHAPDKAATEAALASFQSSGELTPALAARAAKARSQAIAVDTP